MCRLWEQHVQLGYLTSFIPAEQEAEYGQDIETGYQISMALFSHPPTPGRVYLLKVQQSPKATPPEGDLIFKHMTLCGYLLLKQQYKRWMECWEHSWKTHFTVQITCKSWDKI